MECHFALIKKKENNCVLYIHLWHLVGHLKYNYIEVRQFQQ